MICRTLLFIIVALGLLLIVLGFIGSFCAGAASEDARRETSPLAAAAAQLARLAPDGAPDECTHAPP